MKKHGLLLALAVSAIVCMAVFAQVPVQNVTSNPAMPLRGMGSPAPQFNCDASVNGIHYTDISGAGEGQWLWACINGSWVNYTTVAVVNNVATQTTLSCSGSGHVTFSEPEQGTSYKVVVAQAVGCIGSATYTFPAAFNQAPAIATSPSAPVTYSYTTTTFTVGGSSTTAEYVLSGV